MAGLFSIAVAWSVFILAWNTRERFPEMTRCCFLESPFFFTGLIDLFHILSYTGMEVFPEQSGANYPAQLWIAARGMEALSLLLFPLFITRRIRLGVVLGIYAAMTAFIMATIFCWHFFSDCYREGLGVTSFKKVAEYVICLTLVGAVALLFRKRNQLDETVFRLMVGALSVSIVGELALPFYFNVGGLSIVVGHFLKIISFVLIYIALIRSSLTRPYTTLFRDLEKDKAALKESEAKLQEAQAIAGMGDFSWDIATGAVTWSDGMYRLLQYDKREGINYKKLNLAFHHPDDLERITKYLKDNIDSGEARLTPNDYRLIRKDGHVIAVQLNGRIAYRDGKATTLFGTCTDISSLKQVEKELQKRDEDLKESTAFLENLNDVAYMADAQGNVIAPDGLLDKGMNFIQKPFSRDALAATVRTCLDEN